MKPVEKTSEDLFQKIRSRFSPVTLGDAQANTTTLPEEAKFFNFVYKEGDKDIGNVTISIVDTRSLKVYYSVDIIDNIKHKMKWYDFLRELRMFAKRNLLSFDARDISKAQLGSGDFKSLAANDGTYDEGDLNKTITESVMFGSHNRSFQNVDSVKIIVNHTKPINEEIPGSRSRNIQNIYILRDDGERYHFPYNYLTGARAMARHVLEGGNPYDGVGSYITNMIGEMKKLSQFARYTRKQAMESEDAANIRNQVVERYHGMKRMLSALSSPKGYSSFVENFSPREQLDSTVSEELKDKFTVQQLDSRIEELLPTVTKALEDLQITKLIEAYGTIDRIINSDNWNLVLKKDDSADHLLKTTQFSDGVGLLGFIMTDIANRVIGDNAEEISNFARNAAEDIYDSHTFHEHDDENKKLAIKLAKKYLDDIKEMDADDSYSDIVRQSEQMQHTKNSGMQETEQYESWINEIVEAYSIGSQDSDMIPPSSNQSIATAKLLAQEKEDEENDDTPTDTDHAHHFPEEPHKPDHDELTQLKDIASKMKRGQPLSASEKRLQAAYNPLPQKTA